MSIVAELRIIRDDVIVAQLNVTVLPIWWRGIDVVVNGEVQAATSLNPYSKE